MLQLVPFEFLFLQVDVKLSVFPFSETWLQISLRVGRASSRVLPHELVGERVTKP